MLYTKASTQFPFSYLPRKDIQKGFYSSTVLGKRRALHTQDPNHFGFSEARVVIARHSKLNMDLNKKL
jgi:hypothetical protein